MENIINIVGTSNSPKSEHELLMEQIAAVLCPPVVQAPQPAPIVTDIGNILLQLTEAVAEAKSEAEKEQSRRIALEKEVQEMKARQFMLNVDDDSNLYGYQPNSFTSLSTPSGDSMVDGSLSLNDCLALVSSSLDPGLVYLSYHNAGFIELDFTMVERIYKPYDFSSLMFIVFNSYRAVVPVGMVAFSLDALQALISSQASSASIQSPANSSSTLDDPPRMNLLEALDVRGDEDCERIITVRKCHKLGFKSHIHLRQYFSKFGKVDRVVLLPMRAKPKNAMDGRGNRPSSMGFVVMESKECADKILNFNNGCGIHEIKGWPIEVRNFVKPADKPDRDVSGTTLSTEYGASFASRTVVNDGVFDW